MPFIADRRTQTTAWVLVGLSVALGIAGNVWDLFAAWAWFDETLHTFASFSFVLLLGTYLYGSTLGGARTHAGLFVVTLGLIGLGLGGMWELFEFAKDRLASEQSTIKGKWDTMIDLVCDTGGALAAGLVLIPMLRRSEAEASARMAPTGGPAPRAQQPEVSGKR